MRQDMRKFLKIVEGLQKPKVIKEFQMPDRNSGIVDRLQAMLQKAGISDEDIRAGIDLSRTGMHKVAARLGVSFEDVPMLLGSLTTRLRDDEKHSESAFESMHETYKAVLSEDDDRFGYEKDSVGNVTVRDSKTDKECFLQGSQATDLLNRLQQDPDSEQAILSGLLPLMEGNPLYDKGDKDEFSDDAAPWMKEPEDKSDGFSNKDQDWWTAKPKKKAEKHPLSTFVDEEEILDEDETEAAEPEEDDTDYLEEMQRRDGTFNFPWKIGAEHGTGTARYKFSGDDGHDLTIKLLSVRSSDGSAVTLDPAKKAKVESLAHAFIMNQDD